MKANVDTHATSFEICPTINDGNTDFCIFVVFQCFKIMSFTQPYYYDYVRNTGFSLSRPP
jgi:hypothetical protein